MDGPGGFPGTGGGRGGGEPADTTRLYGLLGVDKGASDADIAKAWRNLARTHHPDKGGDPEKFKEIARAYEVLGDPDKRAEYDASGEEGLPAPPPGRRRRKTKDVVQPLKVTLEQLYAGATKKMAVTRTVIDRKKGVTECRACGGRGVKVEVVRMGPLVQQMRSACEACGGQGRSFGTANEREVLEVVIQKGAMDGHKIPFREMADERPGADTGDVIFVCNQQEHPMF